MVVGAVDQAGERTAMSGTSMASPNVLNLAAKLIAVDPELQPRDVISLIVPAADDGSGSGLARRR